MALARFPSAASSRVSYEVIRPLASGGMGELFVARRRDPEGSGELVVVKQMRAELANRNDGVRLFLDEARVLSMLHHPNLVKMHDFGFADGRYYLVMELVHGQDLRRLLRQLLVKQQAMPLAEALSIVLSVCAGLHYAHERAGEDGRPLGIVHRDISPSNVLVGYDGVVKLSDFGIAKAAIRTTRTRTGILRGKVGYMSPEQCRCAPLTRTSDVFAIGTLLYEVTTTTRLFKAASDFEVMKRIVEDPIPPPSTRKRGYPRELERIVLKALERLPERRYASALALQLALQEFATKERLVTGAPPVSRLMGSLFADAARRAVKQEEFVADRTDEDVGDEDSTDDSVVGLNVTRPGQRARSYRRAIIAAGALLGLLLGAGLSLFMRAPKAPPSNGGTAPAAPSPAREVGLAPPSAARALAAPLPPAPVAPPIKREGRVRTRHLVGAQPREPPAVESPIAEPKDWDEDAPLPPKLIR